MRNCRLKVLLFKSKTKIDNRTAYILLSIFICPNIFLYSLLLIYHFTNKLENNAIDWLQ